jgi:hypothetical protein
MNNNLEFENEDPSPDSIEDNHPRTNYGEGYGGKKTLKEDAEIDLTNLCYYDKRNPDCSVDDEDIECHKKSLLKKNKTCSCDNCFYGRSKLTEQLILQAERMYSEEDIKSAFYTDNRKWSNRFQDYIEVDFDEWLEQFKKK